VHFREFRTHNLIKVLGKQQMGTAHIPAINNRALKNLLDLIVVT
jgi:hypothetical protein